MKHLVSTFKLMAILAFSIFIMSACTSREKKVAETIKDNMFKTLYDFESYQPIETKIDSLKRDKYGDTLIYDNIMLARAVNEEFNDAKKEFDDQEETANIYRPTTYSSSYNDAKFEKARDKMGEALAKMKLYANILDSIRVEAQKMEKNCDGKQYGWLVTHKFRCKTKGGNPTIGTYIYFMDMDCERIIRSFDEDDLTYESYKEWVDSAIRESDDDKTK